MLFSLFFCTVYYSFIICYLIIYDSVGIETQDPIITKSGNSNVNHSGYLFYKCLYLGSVLAYLYIIPSNCIPQFHKEHGREFWGTSTGDNLSPVHCALLAIPKGMCTAGISTKCSKWVIWSSKNIWGLVIILLTSIKWFKAIGRSVVWSRFQIGKCRPAGCARRQWGRISSLPIKLFYP